MYKKDSKTKSQADEGPFAKAFFGKTALLQEEFRVILSEPENGLIFDAARDGRLGHLQVLVWLKVMFLFWALLRYLLFFLFFFYFFGVSFAFLVIFYFWPYYSTFGGLFFIFSRVLKQIQEVAPQELVARTCLTPFFESKRPCFGWKQRFKTVLFFCHFVDICIFLECTDDVYFFDLFCSMMFPYYRWKR